MKSWKYSKGKWSNIETLLKDSNEDSSLDKILEFNGYETHPKAQFGEVGGYENVEIYCKKEDIYSYIICFGVSGSTWEIVIIDGLPDLMNWLKDYGTFFLLRRIEGAIEEIEKHIRKKENLK